MNEGMTFFLLTRQRRAGADRQPELGRDVGVVAARAQPDDPQRVAADPLQPQAVPARDRRTGRRGPAGRPARQRLPVLQRREGPPRPPLSLSLSLSFIGLLFLSVSIRDVQAAHRLQGPLAMRLFDLERDGGGGEIRGDFLGQS